MMLFSLLAGLATLQTLFTGFGAAAPVDTSGFIAQAPGSSTYWVSDIARNGTVAFGTSGYQIFRNVMDFGAKGDGSTDDTAAINSAISSGSRCGQGCDSSTITPAIVFFPAGTYVVSTPLIQYYYTQFIGDALNPPTLKAAAGFTGMAVIDSDPYDDEGNNWYTNQNNFFRQVRNFVIDLTAMPQTQGAGIHWQVAQATSLQNIVFNMAPKSATNKQQGIFMDNGSGGFMTDLVFNGGNMGAFLGNQQFTTRNMTFNGCNTAIYMNWNWLWAFKSLSINNCGVGIDMANDPSNQTVGSVLVQDSKFTGTPVGINSSFSSDSIPTTGGSLILDNVDFTGSTTAVQEYTGSSILAGGSVVDSWVQGRTYAGSTGSRTQGAVTAPSKPASLLNGNNIFERSKPQYEQYPVTSFVSVKSQGAAGDGVTDDTNAIQNAMNNLQSGEILYFDHGAYVVTKTINVPNNIMMTGEIWPLIMASGSFFSDMTNPQPVFSIGSAGDTGAVEMSDMIFETKGPAPGAILIQWNSAASSPGSNGMWDVHARVGGSAGTELQSNTCSKDPNVTHAANPACEGSYMMFHASNTSSVYVENCWFWTSDHELDLADHNQVDVYNGRGVLIESQGPVWLYGTASEHSVLYNYQLNGANDIYMSLIQSETPYYQENPAAPAPFTVQGSDPQFNGAANTGVNMAWGLRVLSSQNVLIYGTGLYSFFDNYDQTCVPENNCQQNMIDIEGSTNNLNIFGMTTKAAVNMISTSGYTVGSGKAVDTLSVENDDNQNVFGATVAMWTPS
jgi:hypothetical protein